MGAFEDFIQDELPLRQVVVKSTGDPRSGDGYIAAIGTYYLDTDDDFKRYEKIGSGNTDWREVPTTSSSGGVQTDEVIFANDSKITTLKIDNMTGTQVLDSFNVNDFKSSKYIIRASNADTIHCSEILLLSSSTNAYITQYGVLGNATAMSYDASVSSSVVSLSGTTTLTGMEVSVYKFLLS
tara:strand:+ start:375 stop:920 length:546 start_codon:yes stop_codon:yes gene_type:complete